MLTKSVAVQLITSRQGAIGIVYAYPGSNRNFEVCEVLATKRGEPSVQTLLEDTAVSDAQHAANWQQIVMYTQTLTPENAPFYNKLTARPAANACWLLDPTERDPDLILSTAEEEQLEAHLNLPWQAI